MKDDIDLGFFFNLLDSEAENSSLKAKFRLKEGERREVCILFADVKNSTVMGSKLDPEVFQSKLDPLMKRFTKCITYYGGFVDKYMGDGIMALFGAKRATEQDTERAVLAGLKMIEQLELYNSKLASENQTAEGSIGIRIGINTGLVVVGKVGEEREGDFTVTGAAVHLAQRMEANAPVGKILMPVHAMQAVERLFEFEPYGNVNAKGFSAPVESYSVVRQRLEKGQRWFRKKAIFIGREKELQQLSGAFSHLERKIKGIDDGHAAPTIIGIRGDAGLGKTRLVHEFCQAYQQRMKLVSCDASGIVRTPFCLFVNLLENEFKLRVSEPLPAKKLKLEEGFKLLSQNLTAADAAELADALPLVGALLEIPYADERLKQSGSELLVHLRLALQRLIKQLLMQHARAGLPIVLVFDDLHWMDDSSAAIFNNLIQNLVLKNYPVEQDANLADPEQTSFTSASKAALQQDRHPALLNKVLIILQYRMDYKVHSEIGSLPVFSEMELLPLSDTEMMRLIKHHTSAFSIPDDILNKVKLLSMGNPFYLEEWCNYLSDLPKFDLKDLPIPANLHALILSRLDMLDNSIRLLLQKAAVIGQEFFVNILSWIEDKLYNPIDVPETLSQLEQQAFILKLIGFDYSAYFFKHITTRDVAYQTLLLENRTILHKLAAEAIEELYPERQQEFLFQLADHYHRAAVADKAIFYLEKAAAAAQKVYSNRQAIELYEKLLSWMQNGTQASACWSPSFSQSVTNNPQSQTEKPNKQSNLTLARIYLHLAEIKSLIGLWDEADADLQQALAHATNPCDSFDYHHLSGVSAFRKGNMETALQEWESCLEIATSNPPDLSTAPLIAIAHNDLGIWYQQHKQYALAFDHYHNSLNYATEINDALRIAKTLSNLGLLYMNQKDYPNAEKYLSECLVITEANQYLQLQSIALGNLGLMYQKKGNPDKAMQFYEKKWMLVDKLNDKAELIKVLGNIGNIHRDQGQHWEALEYYRRVLAIKETLGNARELSTTHNAIATVFQTLERFPEALAEIDKAIEYATQNAAANPQNLSEYLYNKADICYTMKNYKQAAITAQQTLEFAMQHGLQPVVAACNNIIELIDQSGTKNE